MSQYVHARTTVSNVNYPIVWSTKYRKKILTGNVAVDLKRILLDIAQEKGFIINAMEVMADHVHVFVSTNPQIPPNHLYKALKGISARRLFIEHPDLRVVLWNGNIWNPSTFIESVGHISEKTVRRYIEDQKK